jgi:hypothetical protein
LVRERVDGRAAGELHARGQLRTALVSVVAAGALVVSDEIERERITRLAIARTGRPERELRLLHTDDGLVVFVSVVAARDIGLPDAHELASRLQDDIRDGQPRMTDVVVPTEP